MSGAEPSSTGGGVGGASGHDVDFSAFVISLGSTAAMQLDPDHESYNVALARQTIDILAMLLVKTAGNLTREESDLLNGVLYQTRLACCEAEKR